MLLCSDSQVCSRCICFPFLVRKSRCLFGRMHLDMYIHKSASAIQSAFTNIQRLPSCYRTRNLFREQLFHKKGTGSSHSLSRCLFFVDSLMIRNVLFVHFFMKSEAESNFESFSLVVNRGSACLIGLRSVEIFEIGYKIKMRKRFWFSAKNDHFDFRIFS